MNAMDRLEAAVKLIKVHAGWDETEQLMRAAEAVIAERVLPTDPEVLWLREMFSIFSKVNEARAAALLDRLFGPTPWQPKKGERVRGFRGTCEVIGPYYEPCTHDMHRMGMAGEFWVERIERLDEPLPPKDGRTP